jgi:SAM-dependent methyltransferase
MTQPEPQDPSLFRRQDESPDPLFYVEPRFTVHIDDHAIAAVTAVYRELLPARGAVLDLMSSWRSHLPEDVTYSRVTGLGLNAEEMEDNPQLTEIVVKDINAEPRLPFEDESFDGVMVTVSVQYMTRPVELFAEVNRVLKPGAPFVLTYSNRCFPTKAIAAWLSTSDQQHANIIATYFRDSGGWSEVRAMDRSPRLGFYSDPLYAVWALKR